jgi:hypothetical protein
MVSTVFSILLAVFSAFVPVVLWGYAFSYLDADRFNARRFLLGAASGAVAVFPIAYMPELLDLLSLGRKNVFSSIAGGQGGMEAAFSLAVFLFLVSLAVFLLGFVLRSVEIFKNAKAYFRSLFSVFLTVPIFFFLFSALPAVFPAGITEVRIAGAVIAGFASITLAYFVVAAVEEGGKHL